MANEDDFLTSWFDRLRSMQSCMKQINNDTSADLAKFYAQKNGDLLLSATQKEQFRSCFFHQTNITIPDDDFKNGPTFHELLDLCYRPLKIAVNAVMRRVAIDNDPSFENTPVPEFGAIKASPAFPSATVVDALCQRLADDMDPFFQRGSTREDALKQALGKPNATVDTISI